MEVTSKSLLVRLQSQSVDDRSWQRLIDLYRPLILSWLRKSMLQNQDAEDLTQEILLVVVRKVGDFVHPGHQGAFRGWLKTITLNKMRSFWRSRNYRPKATGSSQFLDMIEELEDPGSNLSRLWNEEHDQYVLERLLELMEDEFEEKTLQAFRRTALVSEPAKEVALSLGMSVGAVYVAKSAVLRRIRQEADGLID
ncbi:sigma-70 family RNA polymerase sigma factor [Stieleria sp. JC731]|uniref:RNA polymerase sigma factor n=1 Tax=Pirellulaceae TaxID=2691357 RepID=UPI001E52B100|nr:sigma-70 family RNA polymerase sigma factor [Stieleria sp. JC731]MCC9600304.1 sigma-70 family RNA polymerase sigma factor [Stieleria sp. JC731]